MAFRTYQIADFLGLSQSTVRRKSKKFKAIKGETSSILLYNKTDVVDAIVKNKEWLDRFLSHTPSPKLRDSYYILKEEVEKRL